MSKKIYTQIRNEWHSNWWLALELLLVSVVMWYVVDYMFVITNTYNEPHGFDVSHCYLIEMGKLTDKSSDYIPNDTLLVEEIETLVDRLRHRPEVEAVSLSANSYPYNGSNSSITIRYDTLLSDYCIVRSVTPDFFRVFRYEGIRGETPEELAQMLSDGNFMASDNLFLSKYDQRLTSFVGKSFFLGNDSAQTFRLIASLNPVRYSDYEPVWSWTSCFVVSLLLRDWYDTNLELCVRVKADQDVDFIERLRADSEKQFRIGNVFIADIVPFANIRRDYQMDETIQIRNYLFGMGFLLLNIFLGLLGTFWFRTQQRRSEIALRKALGSTNRDVFRRLLAEGMVILVIATIPAVIVDWNLAYAELNYWMNGTTLEPVRFIITVAITFLLIALMIVLGTYIPARKAMKIEPAEALHDE
ncbi:MULTISPECIES: FtsX-like permease family protein [unclassified Bacteroides]|mgnify:CR=1 FL=1|jgi:putative ABC transport system permease protein|uniref:ABC transporter permease n=1 Tax=unclassified Bacteroides TaxID=2646097 RepID=UPI000E97E0BD|nr:MULTISPECIES: FtsX-like permease family protein [unclassified Bacteroides]RGN49123.1 ABC transporter permease [Bacteroides sp. OM05-12]RHR83233.1 ABC transporter permease [Bacteroides sp. AF16-49]